MTGLFGLGISGAKSRLNAQPVWSTFGEVSGIVGGTWARADNAPTVTTGAGALLGLGAQRVAERYSVGGSLRISSQSITVTEFGDTWSGGTFRELQALATAAWPLLQRGPGGIDAEVAAGVSARVGEARVEPFTSATRLAPLGEVGISARRGEAMALFARYGVLHVNPSGSANIPPGTAPTNSGWVGRITLGLRVFR